jgi:DNA polymerase-1
VARKARLTLLIDADIVTYAHARKGQRVYDFDDGDDEPAVCLDDIEVVQESADREITELMAKFETENVILCYTDTDGNFRKRVLPTYKAGRPPKPEHYYPLRDLALREVPHVPQAAPRGRRHHGHPRHAPHDRARREDHRVPRQGHEADTGEALQPRQENAAHDHAEEGAEFFYTQVLTGDPVDVYKGCPGVGPKTAADPAPRVGQRAALTVDDRGRRVQVEGSHRSRRSRASARGEDSPTHRLQLPQKGTDPVDPSSS